MLCVDIETRARTRERQDVKPVILTLVLIIMTKSGSGEKAR